MQVTQTEASVPSVPGQLLSNKLLYQGTPQGKAFADALIPGQGKVGYANVVPQPLPGRGLVGRGGKQVNSRGLKSS